MKIKNLEIHNIGPIDHMLISIEKPLSLFYGEIKAGKTTVLNSVKLCFGGGFPEDIIRHGETEAFVELSFDNGHIRREFYTAKDGATKARQIEFIVDGQILDRPVTEIEKYLNPFLLDQDHLIKMTELERKKYFTDFFGTNTKELDKEINSNMAKASSLRSEIKGYGNIEVVEVEKIDVESLKLNKAKIQKQNEIDSQAFEDEKLSVEGYNENHEEKSELVKEIGGEIVELEDEISSKNKELESLNIWLSENKAKEFTKEKPVLDFGEIDTKIESALTQNAKYDQYQKDKIRLDELKAKRLDLSQCESKVAEIKKEKISKLAEISKTSNIEGLVFDEEGNFTFENTSAGMLSTSQMMTLSTELANLYPEGFGITLIDRGESLGKSIFDYVTKATEKELTILATIVGEKAAKIPENIGVFVVEKGNLKNDDNKI